MASVPILPLLQRAVSQQGLAHLTHELNNNLMIMQSVLFGIDLDQQEANLELPLKKLQRLQGALTKQTENIHSIQSLFFARPSIMTDISLSEAIDVASHLTRSKLNRRGLDVSCEDTKTVYKEVAVLVLMYLIELSCFGTSDGVAPKLTVSLKSLEDEAIIVGKLTGDNFKLDAIASHPGFFILESSNIIKTNIDQNLITITLKSTTILNKA